MKVICLDTEYASVTGEIAQLSCLVTENGQKRACNWYFRVTEMDEGAYRVNGLSKEWLDENGVEPETVKAEILDLFSGAVLCAHNLNADKRVLEKALGKLPNAYGMCTMYRFAATLKLPGGRPYKMPSLRELMEYYGVTEELVNESAAADFGVQAAPHDARWDAEAVQLCVERAVAHGDCRDLFHEAEKKK